MTLTYILISSGAPFCIVSDEITPNYKLEIICVEVKVGSGVLINQAEIMKKTTAKYPLHRTEVIMNTCPSG